DRARDLGVAVPDHRLERRTIEDLFDVRGGKGVGGVEIADAESLELTHHRRGRRGDLRAWLGVGDQGEREDEAGQRRSGRHARSNNRISDDSVATMASAVSSLRAAPSPWVSVRPLSVTAPRATWTHANRPPGSVWVTFSPGASTLA